MAGSLKLECLIRATLLPLLVLSTTCSAPSHTTLYVKPTLDTLCLTNPCLTLSEYAQETDHYLISNTTVLLLPGDHVLTVNFTVENVSHFEIHTQLTLPDNYTANRNRIVCQGLVGFMLTNISHVMLRGLTFNYCGKRLNVCRYDPVTANYTTHLTIYEVWWMQDRTQKSSTVHFRIVLVLHWESSTVAWT